jgi:phage tail P2-like protein
LHRNNPHNGNRVISDLLPPNATPQERALSVSCGSELNIPIKQLWSPFTCPAEILPWLAWSLGVDQWDSTWPDTTKRQVISESIAQHFKKGTSGALRRTLQKLGYEVEINEATGTAYTFRLRFKVGAGESAGGAVLQSAIASATATALIQKNARSALSGTDLLSDTDPVIIYVGGVAFGGIEAELSPA